MGRWTDHWEWTSTVSGEVDLGVWAKEISNWLFTVLKGTSCGENADWGFRVEGDRIRPQSPMVWSETGKPRKGGVTGSVQVENWWEMWLGGVPGCSYGRVRRLGCPTWWVEPEPAAGRRRTSWGTMGELDEGHYSSRMRDREEDQRELKRLVVKAAIQEKKHVGRSERQDKGRPLPLILDGRTIRTRGRLWRNCWGGRRRRWGERPWRN